MVNAALRISTKKSELDVPLIHAFLHDHAPWSKGIPIETVERSIEESLCFGAFLATKQVGFARVITDMATFGYLCDMFILPAFRSRGYARELMHYICSLSELRTLRRIVLVTSNAHAVYRPFGFESLVKPDRYMELHRPEIYAQRQD